MSRKCCILFPCLFPLLVLSQRNDSLVRASENILLRMDILPAKTVSLQWKNDVKSAGGYFFLERRADVGNFETIVTIRSDSADNYRALDEKPFAGTNYYRIKFVDREGNISYSPPVAGNITTGNFCRFYPNPADDHVIIQTTVKTIVQLFSPNGSQIFTQNVEKGLAPIDLSSFGRGIYVLTFINAETKASIRNILYKN